MKEREPTRDELLAMAYVDGELGATERAEFEARLGSEPALVREVADLQRLAVLARQVTPREPKDYEWKRLEALHESGVTVGLFALIGGATGLLAWALFEVFTELEFLPQIFLALLIGGLTLLFVLMLRARMRTLPYDPYTEVER